MFQVIVLLVALCAQKVYSSAYNSPSVQLFTPTHPSHGHHGDLRYHGPTAIPHVLHDGHIADTHEVAAAKAEHFAAVSRANDHSDGYAEEYRGYSGHGDIRYQGPTAIPHVLHDGHIADTHEVAAAKAEHFAAVAKAQTDGYNHGVHGAHSGTHRGFAPHASSYHGPIAKPHVLHTGYLADTHEVAAAKHHHYQALSAASHQSHDHYHH